MTSILARLRRFAPASLVLAAGIAGASVPAAAADADKILPVPLYPTIEAPLRACATKAASGLGYTVLKPATGAKPGKSDFVLVNYIGYLAATGAVFDQNKATPLNLDNVIPGFTEGLQMMPIGSIYRLCIPAALGYGAQASEAIPANSDLVFQIELIDSKTMAEVEKMRQEMQAQQAAPAAPGTKR
ncbi:FKBP-type peptidyl-prolyl cis-trans isomerase [Novosphingobium sp. KCTC 2891]|uniref:FKBP-type peptidyl-prolyl cis-trans isomerase n=1 Tax=Novosphingobium sp. KCTC 2891 TaxID=2989730 RepID=UPI0022220E0C|nr:FKBP-type peptidyl-prolyl cis-trans isomerase [Novosphingobium sp. KCTC 2891]MCW1382631.1 FKBP-type peptidyl-prolyl cis-trans isomerase [Novosphingobium sp. KCTC 2891]